MKRILLTAVCALCFAAPAARAGNLTVHLDGVRGTGGTLFVTVQTRGQFMQEGGIARGILSSPQAGAHQFAFQIPAGDYAISVWHDDNGNGRFDKDDRHMPLDGWALSNSQGLRGEPGFDQIRIRVGDEPSSVSLSMTYGR